MSTMYGSSTFNEIRTGNEVRVGNSLASLDSISTRPKYDLKIRSYCQQEYAIDQACHVLIKTGEHTEELAKTLDDSQSILLDYKPYFPTIKTAIKKLMGVDFGTRAYNPFVIILAPVYVKVSNVQVEDEKIIFSLNASLDASIERVKTFLFGTDDNGEQTELSENITVFQRIGNSENFLPVKVNLDDKSTYVKVVIYYGDEFLEDFFVKRVRTTDKNLNIISSGFANSERL